MCKRSNLQKNFVQVISKVDRFLLLWQKYFIFADTPVCHGWKFQHYKNSLACFDCPRKLKCEGRHSKLGCFNDYLEF